MKFKIIPNEQTPELAYDKGADVILKENDKLLRKFLSFTRRQHNCAGLASNQVSVDGQRIDIPFFAILDDRINFWDIVINPIIEDYIGNKETKIEGCLTWLGKKIEVERYPAIKVMYCNLKGEGISEVIEGYLAQVFQHEYNHLKGIEEKVK